MKHTKINATAIARDIQHNHLRCRISPLFAFTISICTLFVSCVMVLITYATIIK